VRGGRGPLGAPGPGGTGQQQQPNLGLRPVHGRDQRVELVGAALGVVDDDQRRHRDLGQHRQVLGAGVLTEHHPRPSLTAQPGGEVAGKPCLALPARTGDQSGPRPVVGVAEVEQQAQLRARPERGGRRVRAQQLRRGRRGAHRLGQPGQLHRLHDRYRTSVLGHDPGEPGIGGDRGDRHRDQAAAVEPPRILRDHPDQQTPAQQARPGHPRPPRRARLGP